LTADEGEFLRDKYRKLFEVTENAKGQDQHLSKKMKVLETDILSEKILLEKARMEEVEETIRVQRAGELRNSLQKELEDVEQKDTIVKFELFELKKVHDELQRSLTNMKKQNSQMVEPVLERLKKEVTYLCPFFFILFFCFITSFCCCNFRLLN
jgi:chromosome segregation ATPase